jgi:hypothetical protein
VKEFVEPNESGQVFQSQQFVLFSHEICNEVDRARGLGLVVVFLVSTHLVGNVSAENVNWDEWRFESLGLCVLYFEYLFYVLVLNGLFLVDGLEGPILKKSKLLNSPTRTIIVRLC